MNIVSEIDFSKGGWFCVYIHSKPNGDPFYIGKGRINRAKEFSVSRRNAHYNNIVSKYGRENIVIKIIPCTNEKEAFELEKVHIIIARMGGYDLANYTDGGEGASGRKSNDAQLAALAKGRLKGKKGKKGDRPEFKAYRETEAFKDHLKRLAVIGAKHLHKERNINCGECGIEFTTHSAQTRCCSRLCEQRFRRAGKNKK